MPPSRGIPAAANGCQALALAALLQVEASGFDVPVVPGDVPALREPGLAGPDLPVQRRDRVLEGEGGGPGQDGDRDGLGRGRAVPRRGPVSVGFVLACPLQKLLDCLGLPRVQRGGLFP